MRFKKEHSEQTIFDLLFEPESRSPVILPAPSAAPVTKTGSLEDARQRVMDGREKGTTCPCCDQLAKTYRRKINEAMVRLLVWLVRSYIADPRFYNIHEFPLIQGRRGGGDFAKLIHWGLVEEGELGSEDDAQRTSGLWKPTEKAIQFVRGAIKVPSHVYLYNNEVVDVSETTISIREALGKKFNYAELMSGLGTGSGE